MTKHLYVHIPFCEKICLYCDFARVIYDKSMVDEYILMLQKEFKKKYLLNKFETIYIGGGTPNCLSNDQLDQLLSIFQDNLTNKYEFTIECNPEKINQSQIDIFNKYQVNRISLGVQTTNDCILRNMNRRHSTQDVVNVIKLLQKNKLNNISCDFIYGFKDLNNDELSNSINLMIKLNINHLSFYSLELKENSCLTKNNYILDNDQIDQQLEFISLQLAENNFKRYEVSNWTKNDKNCSQHNLAYWHSCDWAALGYKAYGFENEQYYIQDGSVLKQKKVNIKYTDHDYHFQIISMGLRMINGLDLSIEKYNKSYLFFKERLDKNKLINIRNNHLFCNNINLLNNILIELI